MESTDQHILALLARDGRMSFTDIGKETGLSTSAAQQRVRRLEQRGVITGYYAQIDHSALGRNLTAFISIRPLGQFTDDELIEGLSQMPEITSCFAVAGDSSFLCVAELGTPVDLDLLLGRIRGAVNVTTVSTVVLRTIFRDRPMVDVPGSEKLY